ncbi:MAG TPA: helix-turn-helix transcriptional regulator, partial [Micavibrio sp.]|nr:helix-turn-helix transcriptional regulator [Micavibrio sp.]
MLITADQIRAARALKNWSQTDLAERTGLAVPTIANIELGKQMPGKNTIEKIIDAFETAGIEFIGERGVQRKEQAIRVFRGHEELKSFYNVIYENVRENLDEILVGNVNERDFVRHMDAETLQLHLDRMKKLNAKYKILVCEDDYFFPVSSYAEYRWIKKEDFSSIPFYVFSDKLAIILWLDEPLVFLMEDSSAASIYREKFMQQWSKAKKPPKNKPGPPFNPFEKDKILKELEKK